MNNPRIPPGIYLKDGQITLAVISKGPRSAVHLQLREHEARVYFEMRVYACQKGEPDSAPMIPTKRGASFEISQTNIGALIDAIAAVEKYCGENLADYVPYALRGGPQDASPPTKGADTPKG